MPKMRKKMRFENYVPKINDEALVVYAGSDIYNKVGIIIKIQDGYDKRWIIRYQERNYTFSYRNSFKIVKRANNNEL